jgi:hypothetical protein
MNSCAHPRASEVGDMQPAQIALSGGRLALPSEGMCQPRPFVAAICPRHGNFEIFRPPFSRVGEQTAALSVRQFATEPARPGQNLENVLGGPLTWPKPSLHVLTERSSAWQEFFSKTPDQMQRRKRLRANWLPRKRKLRRSKWSARTRKTSN